MSLSRSHDHTFHQADVQWCANSEAQVHAVARHMHATACDRVACWEIALSILQDKRTGTFQKPKHTVWLLIGSRRLVLQYA